MKKLVLSIFFFTTTLFLFGQNEINFDINDKKLEQFSIIYKKESILVIQCENSAKLNFKLTTDNKSFDIKTPEILKPIFQIAPGVSILSNGRSIDNIGDCIIRLNKIVEVGSNQYNSKRALPDYRNEAKDKVNEIINLYITDQVAGSPNSTLNFDYTKNKEQLDAESKQVLKKDKELIKDLMKIVSQDYNFLVNTNRALIKATEYPDGYYQYIQQLNVIETSDYENSMNSLKFLIESLDATNEIKSNKFTSTKDVLSLSGTFLHPITKDTIYKLKTNLYSIKKFSFSFSSGIFYNQIVDSKYYIGLNPDTESNNNFVKSEETDNFDVAFGALAHYSYRLTSGFGVGLNTGIALSAFDAKARYLVGGSILIGRKNQFIINAGVAFARREFLSDQIMNNNMMIPKSIATIPTFSRVDNSIYFGITYNIFKVK